jgi:hypothetical protein
MNGDVKLGAARLFFGDAVIVFLLLNEVRHRIVAWVFGVAREDSNRVTVIAVGSLADGLQGGAARVLGGAALPSVAAAAMGAAALRETAQGIAGARSRSTPLFGSLIAFAVLGTFFGPALRGSFRGLRRAVRGFGTGSRRFMAFVGGQ